MSTYKKPASYSDHVLDLIAPVDKKEKESEGAYIDSVIKSLNKTARKEHTFFKL